MSRFATSLILATTVCLAGTLPAAEPVVIDLWQDKPPGFQVKSQPEKDLTGPNDRPVAGRAVIRLGNVAVLSEVIRRESDAQVRDEASGVLSGPELLLW